MWKFWFAPWFRQLVLITRLSSWVGVSLGRWNLERSARLTVSDMLPFIMLSRVNGFSGRLVFPATIALTLLVAVQRDLSSRIVLPRHGKSSVPMTNFVWLLYPIGRPLIPVYRLMIALAILPLAANGSIILISPTTGVGPKKRTLIMLRGWEAIVVTLMMGSDEAAAVRTVFGP